MTRTTIYLVLLFILLATGCDAGGCSGCGGGPVPGGFPLDKRLENGGQLRVTSSGFGFLKEHYPALLDLFGEGGLSFPIAPTSMEVPLVGTVAFCPDGGCTANVLVEGMNVAAKPDDRVNLSMRARIWTSGVPFRIDIGIGCLCWEACRCGLDLDTRNEDPLFNTFSADLVFGLDPVTDYATVTVARARVTDDLQSEDLEVTNLNFCGLAVCNALDIGFIKDFILGEVANQLSDIVKEAGKSALCRPCGTGGCPEGSTCDGDMPGDVCLYPDDSCVPSLLGIESRIDPTAATAGLLPGLRSAPVDMVVAAGGFANVDTGVNLGLMVGAEPAAPMLCGRGLAAPPLDPLAEAAVLEGDTFRPCAPCAETGARCEPGYLCVSDSVCLMSHHQLDAEGRPVGCRGHGDCLTGNGFLCVDGACLFAGSSCRRGGDTPAMLSLGLSERALSRILFAAAGSGLLCMKLGTPAVPALTTSTLALAVPAVGRLAWRDAPVLISTAPGATPRVEVKDWPLVTAVLPSFTIDFYAFLNGSYARILGVTADVRVGVNLFARGGKVAPSIAYITADGVSADASGILDADAEQLSGFFSSILANVLPMLLGALALEPVAIPEVVRGLSVTLPDGGITHLSQGSEDYLALFLDLAVPDAGEAGTGGGAPVETRAALVAKTLVPAGDPAEAAAPAALEIEAGIAGTEGAAGGVEVRYRLDSMLWSDWTDRTAIGIADPIFLLDGVHEVAVAARLAGRPETEDPTPVVLRVTIDRHAPLLRAAVEGEAVRVEASDAVSARDAIDLRARFDRAGEWRAVPGSGLVRIPAGARMVEVEAADGEGNRSRVELEIRGRVPPPDETGTGGCSCGVAAGAGGGGGAGAALGILCGLLGLGLARRRRQNQAGSLRHRVYVYVYDYVYVGIIGAVCMFGGCSVNGGRLVQGCRTDSECYPNHSCCPGTGACVSQPSTANLCGTGAHCEGEMEFDPDTCLFTGSCCVENDPLPQGRIGAWASFAAAADGTVWASGYNEGAGPGALYGDLVAGRWNAAAGKVEWKSVDGIPAGGTVTGAPSGWRGGVGAAGEDVGLHTSTVVMGDGTIVVFYYDRTGGRLKVATGTAAGAFTVAGVVDDEGDAGEYASAALLGDGSVAVAYRAVARDVGGTRGQVATQVRYAVSRTPGAGRFTIETAASELTPCWKEACPAGRVCRADNGLCAAPDEGGACGAAGCGGAAACVDGACVPVVSHVADAPRGLGVWTALRATAGGAGILFYHGTDGDLVLLERGTAGWAAPRILDGDEGVPARAGNKGWAPSLAADASGGLHAAYMDADNETLIYADAAAGAPELVDSGLRAGGAKHRVGESTAIVVDGAGRVRIAYMDATDGRLLMAIRTPEGGWGTPMDITPPVPVPQPDATLFYGFFTTQRLVGQDSYVLSFFVEQGATRTVEDARLLVCAVAGADSVACR